MSAKRANRQKLEELKKKLVQLENVKLPAALKKYGEATQESSDCWHQPPCLKLLMKKWQLQDR